MEMITLQYIVASVGNIEMNGKKPSLFNIYVLLQNVNIIRYSL